jgi:hypothetical protein
LAIFAALTASIANAAPSHITRTKGGNYKVTYDYNDKAKTGWHIGARAGLSFLNWENEYSTDPEVGVADNTEKFSANVFGGSLFAGRTFNYFWRAELEAGLIGQYDDKDEGYQFKLTVPYVTLNGYYDFVNGFYVGAGIGIALPKTELDDEEFISGTRNKRNISPMGALMFGYTHELDYNLDLDIRYRLSAFQGTKHTRVWKEDTNIDGTDVSNIAFTNDIGLILDNSLSIGVRYKF